MKKLNLIWIFIIILSMQVLATTYLAEHFDNRANWDGCVDMPDPWAGYSYNEGKFCNQVLIGDSWNDAHGSSGKSVKIIWSSGISEKGMPTRAAENKGSIWAGYWWRHDTGYTMPEQDKWIYFPTVSGDRNMLSHKSGTICFFDGYSYDLCATNHPDTNNPSWYNDESWHYFTIYASPENNDIRVWRDGIEMTWNGDNLNAGWSGSSFDSGSGDGLMTFGYQSRNGWIGHVSYFDDIIIASTQQEVEDFIGSGGQDNPVCGDTNCDANEDCSNCPNDCGECTSQWKTTFDCSEWTHTGSGGPNCDSLSIASDSRTGTKITSSANYPGGDGGRGMRQLLCDGNNAQSSGLSFSFSSKPEIWIRWYMRYEQGFKWSGGDPSYDKWLYIYGNSGNIVPEYDGDEVNIWSSSAGNHKQDTANWQSIMEGLTGDGKWHYYEVHLKEGPGGIGELWIDGTKYLNYQNYGHNSGGWNHLVIGSNCNSPNNGDCGYVDFDDVEISTTGYIGPIGGSNPYCGDTTCDADEDCNNCETDCGTCDSPSINSVSGTISDGNTITISGSGFGSHTLDVEWLGGPNGNIEQGTIGEVFSKTNWDTHSEEYITYPRYSTTQSHSGSKSVHCDGGDSNTFNSILMYDPGEVFNEGDELFASWWTYLDAANTGQWKMFRLNHYPGWSDTDPEITMFNWHPGSDGMKQFVVRSESEETYWLNDYPNKGEWNRVDLYLKMSTGSAEDGIAYVAIHRPNEGISEPYDSGSNWPNIRTGDTLRHFVWQNYLGNGLEGEVWMDDFYIQRGTGARVEICDQPNINDCTWMDIQKPISWSDNSIQIEFNKGSFSGTAYLYIIDENSKISQGYPISINEKPSNCVHNAEIEPCNGEIDNTEINAYIIDWKDAQATLQQLIDAIQIWKQ